MSPILATERALPPDEVLRDRSEAALGTQPVTILERHPHLGGTFPKEIIRCALPDGGELRLFCKHGMPRDPAHGHRGGVSYEGRVYDAVLSRIGMPVPQLVGWGTDGWGEWLMLRHVEPVARVSWRVAWMEAAADWLGAFHARSVRAAGLDAGPLTFHDGSYFRGWSERTLRFAASLDRDLDWLPGLCDWFAGRADALVAADCVIHGEFTVDNLLVHDRAILPADWESAALAAGECDLAMLLDGWPDAVATRCRTRYATARWPAGAPDDLDERMRIAEAYVHLRWLGDRPEWTAAPGALRRFRRLHGIARHIGVAGAGA